MEDIAKKMNLVDCIRACKVCKFWRSVASEQKNKLQTSQLPWLVLSPVDQQRTKTLQFFDLYSSDSVYTIRLPKTRRGWWYCCSSNGWLVLANGPYLDLRIVLFDPNSNLDFPLPLLNTIPSFRDFVLRNGQQDLIFYVNKIQVNKSSDSKFTVAASFCDGHILALCRPRDKNWRVVFNGVDTSIRCKDFLLHKGILYVLMEEEEDEMLYRDCVKIGGCDVFVKRIPHDVSLRVSCMTLDPSIWVAVDERVWTARNFWCKAYLVESDDEIFIAHQILTATEAPLDGFEKDVWFKTMVTVMAVIMSMLILSIVMVVMVKVSLLISTLRELRFLGLFVGNVCCGGGGNSCIADDGDYDEFYDWSDSDEDEDEEDEDGGDELINVMYLQTEKFELFKIDDPTANTVSVTRVNNLGDRVLFLSPSGSLSAKVSNLKGWGENCIFFLDENCSFFVGEIGPSFPELSRDYGIYHLEDGSIKRCFPNKDRLTWFFPKL